MELEFRLYITWLSDCFARLRVSLTREADTNLNSISARVSRHAPVVGKRVQRSRLNVFSLNSINQTRRKA